MNPSQHLELQMIQAVAALASLLKPPINFYCTCSIFQKKTPEISKKFKQYKIVGQIIFIVRTI